MHMACSEFCGDENNLVICTFRCTVSRNDVKKKYVSEQGRWIGLIHKYLHGQNSFKHLSDRELVYEVGTIERSSSLQRRIRK